MDFSGKKCVLICAGELLEEDKEELFRLAYDGHYFIAVDGGADYCREMDIIADMYLGDFDSITDDDLSDVCDSAICDGALDFPEIITLPKEKDDTDTLAALKKGLELGFKEFVIFGGCGGRLDHTIANIQCLVFLRRKGCRATMMNGKETIFIIKDEAVSFPPSEKGLLSLFAVGSEARGVSISGMKYNLEDAVLTNEFPIGISNEFVEQEVTVTVKDGEVLVILRG